MRRLLTAVGLWLLVAAAQAGAHHSFAAEFDATRLVTMRGTIALMEWVNPHSMLWIDVPGPAGRAERWGLELSPPNRLMRHGLRREMLRPGDPIVVKAYPARDGRRFASVQSLELANGLIVGLEAVSTAPR